MPSSVGGSDNSSRNNSLNDSQRSCNINNTNSSTNNSNQTAQAKGNLAGVSVSKSASTPKESPAQIAKSQQTAGNLNGLKVSKSNATTDSPVAKKASQTTDVPDAAAVKTAVAEIKNYTVKAGDTLSGIAAKAGVKLKEVIKANPAIKNPDLILVGQKINVPTANKQATPNAVTSTPKTSTPKANTAEANAETATETATASAVDKAATDKAAAKAATDKAAETTEVDGITAKKASPSFKGLSVEQLRSIVPNLSLAKAKQYTPLLNQALEEFKINTPQRQAAFVAQLAHESVGLTAFEEFASGRQYEGRKDLGNTQPGDGVRFKGRGPIQLTGRANYRETGKALGVDLENNPKLAAKPELGFRIAARFFATRGLNKLADQGKFDAITKRVNGGFNGKADRDRFYARAKNVLGI